MGVDERRHDDAAIGVNDLRLRVLGTQHSFLADLGDFCALVGNSAMLIIAAALRIPGDEPAVCDQSHLLFPL